MTSKTRKPCRFLDVIITFFRKIEFFTDVRFLSLTPILSFVVFHIKLMFNIKKMRMCMGVCMPILKTCLYNVDPLKPDFYILKLGFTGVFYESRVGTFLISNF